MNSTPTIIICINGINENPGANDAWTDEATAELNLRTGSATKAEKFEYLARTLTRWIRQRKRAESLARRCKQFSDNGWHIVLVGHSNGCDLIARVLALEVPALSVHLFAPAADEATFAKAIAAKAVRRIHIYGSPDDGVLKTAWWTRWMGRLVGLGYGSMGLRGAEFARAYPAQVRDHSIRGYGHSTWFDPGWHFRQTMDLLLKNHHEDIRELS